MDSGSRVVCVGDALVDLIALVPRLPERGGAVWSPPTALFAGGTAANVAAGLAAVGVAAAFAGCVGDDEYGHFLAGGLEGAGVDISALRHTTDAATGAAFAMVEPGGERTFIACAQGAAQTRLRVSDLDSIAELAPAAVFLTGVLLLEEPSRGAMLELATRYSGRIPLYFDPNLRQPGSESIPEIADAMRRVAGMSDVVLAGEGEVESLGLAAKPGQALVVKRGSSGARLLTQAGIEAGVPAHRVEAVDATGAGDAFNAGYIAARTRGYTDREALGIANATAALSVTRPGARSAPGWDEVMQLYTTARGL